MNGPFASVTRRKALIAPHSLVIFDCDGVLIDSEVIDVRVGRRMLAQLGWHLSREEIVKRFVGQATAHFTASVEAVLGHTLEATWSDAYAAWYDAAYERDLQAVPGVVKALGAIRGPVCVASNSKRGKVRRDLARTGLLERFEPHTSIAPRMSQAVSRLPTFFCMQLAP